MVQKQSLPSEEVASRIVPIRGRKVLVDADLANLYGVSTKRFNESVRRNLERFPPDFMFQLSEEEAATLRSQIATSKTGRGGRRYLPYVFTEHGAIMAASVLNSARAIEVSVFDQAIAAILSAIRALMAPPVGGKRSSDSCRERIDESGLESLGRH